MSVYSMTGFASAERDTEWGRLSGELRSVNHRYLEFVAKLPEDLRTSEATLRTRTAERVQRGKLDLSMRLRGAGAGANVIRVDESLVDRLGELADRLQDRFPGLRTEFTELLRFPGVMAEVEIDSEGLQREATALLDNLLDDFLSARGREGERLAALISERLDGIEALAAQVREWMPEIREALQNKLRTRLENLDVSVDPGRIEQELVLGLQKMDVEEELDRLLTHVAEARRILAEGGAMGRRLDFLMQEFNREANTLGSKSVDARSSQAAVDLKVLIEQMREQVQNLE